MKVREVIATLALLGAFISIIMLIGTAGAIECDSITLAEGTKRGIIWIVILAVSVIGIIHEEKEEENIYDKL